MCYYLLNNWPESRNQWYGEMHCPMWIIVYLCFFSLFFYLPSCPEFAYQKVEVFFWAGNGLVIFPVASSVGKWSRYTPRCVLCREMVSLYSPLRPLSGSGVISTPRYNVKNVTSDPNDPKCLPPTTEIYCLTRQRNKEEEGTEKLTDNFAIFCFF